MRDRQKAAIDSRLGAPYRAQVENAGVDGATTPPKPGKKSETQSSPNGSASTPQTQSPTSSTGSRPAPSGQTATPQTNGSTNALQGSSASPDAEQPSSEATNTPLQSSEPSGETTPDTAQKTSSERGPRYDVKSMKKWAEQNPEQAAEIRVHVFGADQDTTAEWVKVQNKKRKMKEEFRTEREKTLSEAAAERAQAKADREAAEEAAGALRPVLDLWQGATRKDEKGNLIPDFDAIEVAFEQTAKMPLDAFLRLRARRGVSNPELTRQRAEIARLQRELEAAKGTNTGAASPAAKPEAAPPPASSAPAPAAAPVATPAVDFEAKWGDDIPKGHKLRQIADWAAKLDAEMDKYHDAELDEYSRVPEDVAAVVLKRELALLTEEEEPPASKKKAPAVAARPNTPKRRTEASEDKPKNGAKIDISPEEFEGSMAERERWALERARKRMRGELV